MIYDFPEPFSPIRQGDIFINVPILDLPDDELPVIDDKDIPRLLGWEEFAATGDKVSALIAVRPTIAIVGTQECDATRAPNITLFEVRPFRDVERKSKETSKPAKWAALLTQHARVNQKWFYLPADETIGFADKMGADFLTPIRLPRLALERLINFRKGRLNEVAAQHFRERLSEFFRRYAYDEWYALTREELTEYQKAHPDAAPFPWQTENHVFNKKGADKKDAIAMSDEDNSEKGILDYFVEGEEAANETADILAMIVTETKNIGDKLNTHNAHIDQLKSKSGGAKASEYKKIALLAASDINIFSKRVEEALPRLEKGTQLLDESYSAYVTLIAPESGQYLEQISNLRNSLSLMLSEVRPVKESVMGFRDSALSIRDQNLYKELTKAASRQSKALDGVISNIEQMESFALRVTFLIDDKFGEPPAGEEKDE